MNKAATSNRQWRLYKGAWIFLEENKERELSREEARNILKEKGLMIRNTYDFDTAEETSFWFVIKDKTEDISELPSSTRKKIRKALKTYNYKKTSLDKIESVGYEIITSAEKSYKNIPRHTTIKKYKRLIEEYRLQNNKEYWCIENKSTGKIVGFSVNTIKSDSCEYDNAKCSTESLHNSTYPYYGLFYIMNRYYLGERKVNYVSDGSRSITDHSNIQDYLIYNFKFRKAYCRLRIHYKLWLSVVIKALFPFRKIIPLQNVRAILKMEEYSHMS